ncbi:RAMP superfamily CRISPR-associated protein [Nostoc sp.]|uniref:RAMP superfamily CRISPR-associated protein n=1 Tax=Nostoc sp. TaxID=1180 RepID=UPI002FFD3BD9
MSSDRLINRNQRYIIERIIVKGTLVLDTPTCLGSGDADGDTDLILLRDSREDKALLMGSSIAGALRNYLREYKNGYSATEESLLFGGLRSDEEGEQSPLIVNDALSRENIKAELRDGVKINSVTRTAEPGAKYDLELLEAETKFDLYFELLIDAENNQEQLVRELAIALQGLECGEISIGMKKRRGFGRAHVENWQVWQFDLQKYDERIAWLTFEHWSTGLLPNYQPYDSIENALGVSVDGGDKRDRLTINATFTLASPLLIRSGQASTNKAPDVVHLKSRRNDELKPILSGTALTGALRHRAERIINTLTQGKKQLITEQIVNEMFGFVKDKKQKLESTNDDQTKRAKASRLTVDESIIKGATKDNDLVQNRIAIDRFTGGALHGALFNEQPIFGGDETSLELKLELRQPKNHEIGLLLLLIKDLWTGDLPVGGTSGIGRGRLQGKYGKDTTITLHNFQKKTTWTIFQAAKDEALVVNDVESLDKFVAALNKELVN